MGKFSAAPKTVPQAGQEPERALEQRCHGCGEILPYPKLRDPRPPGNRIVGRSNASGYVCRSCYEQGEHFDYRDRAMRDFREAHKDDDWGALMSASYHLANDDDRRDLLAALRRHARKIGNPEAVERASSSAGHSSAPDEAWFRSRGMVR